MRDLHTGLGPGIAVGPPSEPTICIDKRCELKSQHARQLQFSRPTAGTILGLLSPFLRRTKNSISSFPAMLKHVRALLKTLYPEAQGALLFAHNCPGSSPAVPSWHLAGERRAKQQQLGVLCEHVKVQKLLELGITYSAADVQSTRSSVHCASPGRALLILQTFHEDASAYKPAAQGQSINLDFLCLLDYLLLELPRHAFTAELQQRTLCIRAEVCCQIILYLKSTGLSHRCA